MKMKFKIEQIAINPPNSKKAKKLLEEIGFAATIEDIVRAEGEVFGEKAQNTAELSFAYQQNDSPLEFETLRYIQGNNWLEDNYLVREGSVSHIGMHVNADELEKWKNFFLERNISIAQEVKTVNHTNEFLISSGRKYHYVIFDTREILGVDLKFIVRIQGENEK